MPLNNENLYDRFIRLDSGCRSILRNDANDIGFFEHQLEAILAKTYDKLYPQLKATMLIPVDTSVNPGAESYAFYSYDQVGMAKVIADYAKDIPNVTITGEKEIRKLRSIADYFHYNTQEIRASQMAGLPLEQRKANVARAAIEQKINRIGWAGDSEYDLYGFLNHPNVPTSDVPNDGTGSTTEWVNKTPTQILRDMEEAITEIIDDTNGVHAPTTLLLPQKQHSFIKRTPYSAFAADSILKVFSENNPEITVIPVNELKGAGTAGKDVMIAYQQDVDMIGYHIPMRLESYPPQPVKLTIETILEARVGGVVLYYPLSANIKEGI